MLILLKFICLFLAVLYGTSMTVKALSKTNIDGSDSEIQLACGLFGSHQHPADSGICKIGGFYEVDYRTIWKWYYLCHCRKWDGSYTDWVFKGNQ